MDARSYSHSVDKTHMWNTRTHARASVKECKSVSSMSLDIGRQFTHVEQTVIGGDGMTNCANTTPSVAGHNVELYCHWNGMHNCNSCTHMRTCASGFI